MAHSTRLAHEWVKDWRLADGLTRAAAWGKLKKVPSYFLEEEVIMKSKAWWSNQKPRRGDFPPATAIVVGSNIVCLCVPR